MKPLQISIITILTFTIFISINTAFGQVAPVLGLPYAFFKTDHEVYPIQYNITNGRLETSLVDLGARSLIVIVNATEDGQLTIELPRKIIDSTRDGKDKPYLVSLGDPYVGLRRINANEIQNDNETRILEINFLKGLWEIEIAGTFFVESNTPRTTINLYGEWSPLVQWQHGIDAEDVKCKDDLELVIKIHNHLPACVKPETARKLIERGWGISEMSIQKTWVEIVPIQCGGNPWEKDWLESHPNDFLVYARVLSKEKMDIITNYYKKLGIDIFDATLVPWENVAVCESCSFPVGYTQNLLVSNSEVDKMLEFGYKISEDQR